MNRYRIDYTVESKASGTVIIEAEDEYDAFDEFECRKEDLIIDMADEIRRFGNMMMCDEPSITKLD